MFHKEKNNEFICLILIILKRRLRSHMRFGDERIYAQHPGKNSYKEHNQIISLNKTAIHIAKVIR